MKKVTRDSVLDVIKDWELEEAVTAVMKAGADVQRYVISVGIMKLRAMDRHARRTLLKRRGYMRLPGKRGKAPMSRKARDKLRGYTVGFLLGWPVNATVDLAHATKKILEAAAAAERRAGDGHYEVALFYERIADRLRTKDFVMDRWTDAEAESLWNNVERKAAE